MLLNLEDNADPPEIVILKEIKEVFNKVKQKTKTKNVIKNNERGADNWPRLFYMHPYVHK